MRLPDPLLTALSSSDRNGHEHTVPGSDMSKSCEYLDSLKVHRSRYQSFPIRPHYHFFCHVYDWSSDMGISSRFKRSAPIEVVPTPETIDEKVLDIDPDINTEDDKSDNEKISLDGLPVLNRDQESDYAALDVVADMIYRTCWPLGWMPFQQVDAEQWMEEVVLGVSIRSDHGVMRSCPAEHPGLHEFEVAMEYLNAAVAMKFTCRSVEFMNRFHV